MITENLTVAGKGVSDDQKRYEIGKRVGEAVNDYFRLRDDCVPAFDPDFGPTKEDAIQALAYRLEPIFMDWRNLHEY